MFQMVGRLIYFDNKIDKSQGRVDWTQNKKQNVLNDDDIGLSSFDPVTFFNIPLFHPKCSTREV